jgi:DNA mismatch repair protein MutS
MERRTMSLTERHALQRQARKELRGKLQQEFPELELQDWYIQYRQLKATCPNAILLYRLGDFYETFEDDAKLIADKLGVTLTHRGFATPKGSKKKSQEQLRCPMAGMPYHAIERYVGQLVADGYRVAVAEQVSETASSKSDTRPRSVFASGLEQAGPRKDMVDREIVRIITPGTIIDAGMLPAAQNNYLVAVLAEGGRIGLAYADLSTGEFACAEFAGDRAAAQVQGELARLEAAEVLTPDDAALRLDGLDPASARLEHDLEFMTKDERELLLPGERIARRVERENAARWAHGHVTGWPAWRWELRTARDVLLHQLRVQSLAGFGVADKPLATRAAGALIQYVHETQNGAAGQIITLRAYTIGGHMFLDPQTRRNLELLEGSGGRSKGSLVGVLDQTRTPMGARLLRRWISQPLLDIDQLRSRQDGVARFVDDALLRAETRAQLKLIGDMERAVNRVIQGATVATPRDMVRLREALRALPALVAALGDWLPTDHRPPTADHRPPNNSEPEIEDRDMYGSPSVAAPASASEATPRSASLREQREARRRPAARYDDDDLFGEGDWDDEPTTDHRPDQEDLYSGPSVAAPLGESDHERATPQTAEIVSDSTIQNLKSKIQNGLDPCADILAFLEQAIDDDPPALLGASNYLRAAEENGERPRRVIRPGFEPAMDARVSASRDAQKWIDDLEAKERARTGIKSLKVGYNEVFHYYIEVSRTDSDRVPGHYQRKQTLVGSERYITIELKEYEAMVLNAREQLKDLEQKAFIRICRAVADAGSQLLATARTVAVIDVYAALAEAAVRGRYVRPSLHDDTRLRITAGRHPVVEQALDEEFIPNDTALDTDEHQILLITGPNMAGKSTALRQVALIVLMAQIGSFVPADAAEIGLADRIFTRIGAQDDIATGQSTFMVEMTETAALLSQSTRRSLIILDEVGRGTSTYDGMAIARAVVEYIHNEPRLGCRTLFATHYHELTELEQVLPRVKNYHMAAVEQDGRVVFLHELRRGGADRSYGIHVAELAGIPRPVIRRASELLADLENQEPRTQNRRESVARGPSSVVENDLLQTTDNGQRTIGQLSLFDLAPSPVIEMLRRLNVNEISPIEALTKLYELQKLANQVKTT